MPSSLLGSDGNLNRLLRDVHLLSEGGVGLPLGRGARLGLLQHLVDLLEREALGLRDQEVGEAE